MATERRATEAGGARLPFDDDDSVDARIVARDRAARERAVDPRFNVALEASAGTGKTRVLVDRYVNLLRAGVDPANVLAITFTRKAAAEMRERIVGTLRVAAERGEITAPRWRELRDRMGDIAISTIDAFCLSLLREFPLEADVDPGFSIADEMEVPRLIDESLDRALRVCRHVAREDENVALVFAQLGDRRARRGLAVLLHRRISVPAALSAYTARAPADLSVEDVSRRGAVALFDALESLRGGLDAFEATGPLEPGFRLLMREIEHVRACAAGHEPPAPATIQSAFARTREHFLTQDGQPRRRLAYGKESFASEADWRRHRDLVVGGGQAVLDACARYRRDLNVLVSRGVWRMFRIAESEYRRTLAAHAVLDFSEALSRALDLLRQMEEFAQSRYRLESRYHHVLVDEFQDTSSAQWELISLLIRSWGEGAGLADSGPLRPSIFIVGDRKQSIYGFRDANVAVLQDARLHLDGLRPDGDVRRTISRSFRAVPDLLAFVNDVCQDVDKAPARRDAFHYDESDRFPLEGAVASDQRPLGLVVGDTPETCAEVTAAEIARLIAESTTIRDRETGLRRPVAPGDIAILFRTRESHREFEDALERHRIATHVYKGLGFFDADEIKDLVALLGHLADPGSNLNAAAWLRSRFVGLSDEALRLLAPHLAAAIGESALPSSFSRLAPEDAELLAASRDASRRWRRLVDRMPPAELLDLVLHESAYAAELQGPRLGQARENVKKARAMVRRIQNRGYTTLARVVAHLDRLAVGDEANAAVDARNAVSLMTIHAAKGLEFPVVFIVNLGRGTGNWRDPIRVAGDAAEEVSVSVGDFLSAADEDAPVREREETKRLLYVALTRARDRLYLGSVLKNGQLQTGRGSLAEVIPPSLLERFTEAARGARDVSWQAGSGTIHRLRVCVSEPSVPVAPAPAGAIGWHDDFEPLAGAPPRRLRASIAARAATPDDMPAGLDGSEAHGSSKLLGTLLHHLVQRCGLDAIGDPETIQAELSRVARAADVPDDERERAVRGAAAAHAALCTRPDLRMLYTSGHVTHEVPFTMREGDVLIRGTIDCLVRQPSGEVVVLEFKTGRRRPDHDAQAELYRRAAQLLFPGAAVDARLIYADAP